MSQLFEIIYEDEALLVVNKPAGLVCHPTKTDVYSSLISRVRLHLGAAAHPQLVNRLDRETSGLTLVAKTESAARTLRRLWEQRQVHKEYLGIVHGYVKLEHGVIEAPLGPDEKSRVAIKDCVRPDGAPAITEYHVIKRFLRAVEESSGSLAKPFTLVRLAPQTGRKHQLRLHLAHLGHPLVGEKLYGGDEDLYMALVENRLTPQQRQTLILPHHALHAALLRFSWLGKEWVFTAEPEAWFKEFAEIV